MLVITPPVPVNDLVFGAESRALSWKPEIIESLSTFGLKSRTSFSDTFPSAGEL